MHIQIVDVVRSGAIVIFRGKSGHSLLANINVDGFDAFHDDVEAEVEFLVLDEEGFVDVALEY